jgi:hypothetical protein
LVLYHFLTITAPQTSQTSGSRSTGCGPRAVGRVCVSVICGSLPSTELCSSSLLVMGHPGTTYPGPVDKVDTVEGVILPKIQFWEASAVLVEVEPPMTAETSGDSFETTQRRSSSCPNRTWGDGHGRPGK